MNEFVKKHHELISYFVWGTGTTVINYLTYFLCTRAFSINHLIANGVSWALSVLFAFWVNKEFVFVSTSWKAKIFIPELCKFASVRFLSGVLETGMLWLLVDFLLLHDGVSKVLASIIAVILNYLFSKLFIFHHDG